MPPLALRLPLAVIALVPFPVARPSTALARRGPDAVGSGVGTVVMAFLAFRKSNP